MPMRSIDFYRVTPAMLSSVVPPVRLRPERRPKSVRFVMQSHALGRPKASPTALIIAAAVAIAIYLIGSRLSD